ncbi:hypothetical protein GP486_007903 [Trichoglossum hirsutum]|uniref:Arrestin C-terminal-like domain-containing protein n=1 Tax=Trichoglossum hirsutum TaxID=265104 RepID=A0A9P8L4I9_9PEZI|nr:hypothetical protein GP486_007903 [Trichoglossum hirsutum]
MTPNNSTSTKFSRPAPANRSLLSRLASPFSARTRPLSEFYITPEEPHRQYFPGDSVKGSVNLTVPKPIRITHLSVCLHGFIRVSKKGNTAADNAGDNPGAGRSKRSGESLGNGYMPLFADEVVLCGEGRLDPGIYNFKFILEFPRDGLPSSIDFERGTISYVITSTLTRPTTISPLTHCDFKVRFVEPIDIASICPPSPRVVTLEPISRHSRGKRSSVRDASHREKKKTASDEPAHSQEVSEPPSIRNSGDQQIPPRSPAPSEVSGESAVSSSTGSLSFRLVPALSITKASRRSNTQGSVLSLADKTITATVHLLRGGCLRGDTVPVRVSINHTKCIKSLHGIIITLYRQGRIDSHPLIPLPSAKSKEADRAKHEDYYPKTRTGLGGLSLSSAGSSSVYRKDLAQTFAPLIIDPRTLSTVVTASVRVPEDGFPTIASVPGGMVTFRYYIEVVIDLGGKLAGQDRVLPRIGLVNMSGGEEGSANMLAAWGGGVVETDHIRREKSVVDVQFEIVVGTKDSARGRRKQVETQTPPQEHGSPELDAARGPLPLDILGSRHDLESHVHHTAEYVIDQPESHAQRYSHIGAPLPTDVPPLVIVNPEEVDDKARLRNAEERLFPSAPPEDAQDSPPSVPTIQGPSAPPLPLSAEDGGWCGDSEHHHGRLHVESTWAPPPQMEVGEPLSSQSNGHPPTDDKHDLERQRLQAEASAPEDFAGDDNETGRNSSVAVPAENTVPTAPILTEADEYGFRGSDMLENPPRYER